MSATATTTLSDTLVVGRQPQQSVGFHPFCPPCPSTSFSISGSSSPSSHLPHDPVAKRSRSPIHIRKPPQWGSVSLSPPAGERTTHHHPTHATTTRSVRHACSGISWVVGNRAPSWTGTGCCELRGACGREDRFTEPSSHRASLRVAKWEAKGEIVGQTNEVYPLPTTAHLLPLFPIPRSALCLHIPQLVY